MARKKSDPLTVILLTGGKGRTGEQVLRSALAQFDDPNVKIVCRHDVVTVREAKQIVSHAAKLGAVICHSIVDPKVRAVLLDEIKVHHVPAVDVLGPTLALLADHLDQAPKRVAGRSYKLGKPRFDRIDAVDYTLAHDDGCGLADLDKADVVLVGASRVSKSVTCFYLAYRGIRAANVPLIRGCNPPQEVIDLHPHKVVGLTMNPSRLQGVRDARAETMGKGFENYSDRRETIADLKYANKIIADYGWQSIDVSYMSVEEVAHKVLEIVPR
jgi:regulator of PEP synthase PpsR (kinase-PPPase family)